MIKTVIFDIDNTLYSYDDSHAIAFSLLCEYVEKRLNIPKEEFKKLHKEMKAEQERLTPNQAVMHNRLVRYQNILEKLDLPLFPYAMDMNNVYCDTLVNSAVPTKDAEKLLKALKERGIRIGIGTDMTARIQFVKLTHLGLMPYIDFMVSSEEAMAEKPSKEFFDLCIKKARADAGECIFIGDSKKKDCMGANTAGMHGIWFRPIEKADDSDLLQTDSLMELLTIMDQLNK